jgi:hypothetical protein
VLPKPLTPACSRPILHPLRALLKPPLREMAQMAGRMPLPEICVSWATVRTVVSSAGDHLYYVAGTEHRLPQTCLSCPNLIDLHGDL